MIKEQIAWADFAKLDIRVGEIVRAEYFPEAKKPAYKLWIDFGAIGRKKTSAQITKLYTPETLLGMQVTAVINFPPRQIANFMSECLVLGVVGSGGEVTLLQPASKTENGLSIS